MKTDSDEFNAPDETNPPRGGQWPLSRWLFLIVLVLAVHLALIFIFGARRPVTPRSVTDVPSLELAAGTSEWLLLNNPTLFALPSTESFAWQAWLQPTRVGFRPLEWTEKPRYLPLATGELGVVFNQFMATNRFVAFKFELKPPPPFTVPLVPQPPRFAEASTLHLDGDIARRPLLTPVKLPSCTNADIIAPSIVQVLVNAAGEVVSAVLLTPHNSSEVRDAEADERALELARAARFAPGPEVTFGRLIFKWCTVPLPGTNGPTAL